MSQLLSCPQGHQWQPSESGEGETADIFCPICGAAGHRFNSPEAGDAEVATGPYYPPLHDDEPSSGVETIPPSGEISVSGQRRAAALPSTEELAQPPVIPGYEILGELGRGGMGMVYRARQCKLDRLVALKILPPETSRDSNFAERFTREARALAKLNNPNIVTVYDFGQMEGLSYFVMEYVDGVNLRQLQKSGTLSPQETLKIMSQICEALQYAHDEGIVHRDIKPENILRDRRGRVKIADFGIAKLLARTTKDYTLTGPWQVLGTFHYMAPEQIENPLSLDHRADIYSLGVMFYEMLTGGLPIGRFALPSQKVKMDERIDEVVLKALEKEPERRYQQVSELKAAIDDLLGQLGSGIQPLTGPRSAATPSLPGERTSDSTAAEPPRQVEVSKDHVRQRVKGLALGLMVTGCLGCLSGSLICILSWRFPTGEPLTAVVGFVGLLQGIVVIIGARQVQRLEAYQFAVLSSFVAMLPCSPAFLIGMPIGIWTLVMLRGSEVKAAFQGGYVETKLETGPPPKDRLRKLFGRTTGWAMLFCLLGSLTTLLPWVVFDFPNHALRFGYQVDWGIGTGLVFLILFLLLVATGFMDPVPIWRPVALFLGGSGAILCPSLLRGSAASLKEGAYLAMVLGVGLLFLGALQIRGILIRRRPPS